MAEVQEGKPALLLRPRRGTLTSASLYWLQQVIWPAQRKDGEMYSLSLVERFVKSCGRVCTEGSRIGAMSAVTTGMTKTKETSFIPLARGLYFYFWEVGNSRPGPRRTKVLAIDLLLSFPASRLESGTPGSCRDETGHLR